MVDTPRTHSAAVSRLLRSTGLLHVPEEAPLVMLVKDLAKQMDHDGGTRIAAAYLSALKDVRRVLAYGARPKTSADSTPPVAADLFPAEDATDVGTVNSLAAFRQSRGIA